VKVVCGGIGGVGDNLLAVPLLWHIRHTAQPLNPNNVLGEGLQVHILALHNSQVPVIVRVSELHHIS